MPTPTRLFGQLALAAIAAVAASLVAPSVSAAADPRAEAQEDLARAQADAAGAVQRYTDALSEQARQEAEIARLEAEIPALRAKAEELKVQVQERAIQLYREGNSGSLSRMLSTDDIIAAARANELTTSAAEHDRDLAAELTRTAKKLERDEAELKVRKAQQDVLVEQLAKERDALAIALVAADAAAKKIEAVAQSQSEFAGEAGAAAGQVATGAAVCPIAGPVVFINDWGTPRSGGRTHQGNDMYGAISTPNVAVVGGTMSYDIGGLGGIGVLLHGDDGVDYYYAHLSRIEGPERRVRRGEVIGFLGDTGNAAGGPPHTHFEIRPGGGPAVNPYPTIRALCLQ